MSELQDPIQAAERLWNELYQALLARLDPETERILRCCEGLQIAIGLASGNWRTGPRRIGDWEDHTLSDVIAEARELLLAVCAQLSSAHAPSAKSPVGAPPRTAIADSTSVCAAVRHRDAAPQLGAHVTPASIPAIAVPDPEL